MVRALLSHGPYVFLGTGFVGFTRMQVDMGVFFAFVNSEVVGGGEVDGE